MHTNLDVNNVAAEVRATVARHHITWRELARRCAMSPSAMRRRLRGEVDFTVAELQEIARVLEVPMLSLVPNENGAAPSAEGAAP